MARFIVQAEDGTRRIQSFDGAQSGAVAEVVDPQDGTRPRIEGVSLGSGAFNRLDVNFSSNEELPVIRVFVNGTQVMSRSDFSESGTIGGFDYVGTKTVVPTGTVSVSIVGQDAAGNESLPFNGTVDITFDPPVTDPPVLLSGSLQLSSQAPNELTFEFRSDIALDSATIDVDGLEEASFPGPGDINESAIPGGGYRYWGTLTGITGGTRSVAAQGVEQGNDSNILTGIVGVEGAAPVGEVPPEIVIGQTVDYIFDTLDDAEAHTPWAVGEKGYIKGYHQPFDGGGGILTATTSGKQTDHGMVFMPEQARAAAVTESFAWTPTGGLSYTFSNGSDIDTRSATMRISGTEISGAPYEMILDSTYLHGNAPWHKEDTLNNRGLNASGQWRAARSYPFSRYLQATVGSSATIEFTYQESTSSLRLERTHTVGGTAFPATGQAWDGRYFGMRSHRKSPFYDNCGRLNLINKAVFTANDAVPGTVAQVRFEADLDDQGNPEAETVYYNFGSVIWTAQGVEFKGPGTMETYAYTDRQGVVHDGTHEFAKAMPVRRVGPDVRISYPPAGQGFHPLRHLHMEVPQNDESGKWITPTKNVMVGCGTATYEVMSNWEGQLRFTGFSLDGNDETYLDSIYSNEFSSAQRETWLRNAPGYTGFNCGNHGGKVTPRSIDGSHRIFFTDMEITRFMGHATLGNHGNRYEDPSHWPSEFVFRNVILGSCSYNHQYYSYGWLDAENWTMEGRHWSATSFSGGRVRNMFCTFEANPNRGTQDAIGIRGNSSGDPKADGSSQRIEFIAPDPSVESGIIDSNGDEIYRSDGCDFDTFFIDMGVEVGGQPIGIDGSHIVFTNGYILTYNRRIVHNNNNGYTDTLGANCHFENIIVAEPDGFNGNELNATARLGLVMGNILYKDGEGDVNTALRGSAVKWRSAPFESDRIVTGQIVSDLKTGDGSALKSIYLFNPRISAESMTTRHFVEKSNFNNTSSYDVVRGQNGGEDNYAALGGVLSSADVTEEERAAARATGLALADKVEYYMQDCGFNWPYRLGRMDLRRHMIRMARCTDLKTGNVSEQTGEIAGDGGSVYYIDTNLIDRPQHPLRDCVFNINSQRVIPESIEFVAPNNTVLDPTADHRAPRLKVTFAVNVSNTIFYDLAVHRWVAGDGSDITFPETSRPAFFPDAWPWSDYIDTPQFEPVSVAETDRINRRSVGQHTDSSYYDRGDGGDENWNAYGGSAKAEGTNAVIAIGEYAFVHSKPSNDKTDNVPIIVGPDGDAFVIQKSDGTLVPLPEAIGPLGEIDEVRFVGEGHKCTYDPDTFRLVFYGDDPLAGGYWDWTPTIVLQYDGTPFVDGTSLVSYRLGGRTVWREVHSRSAAEITTPDGFLSVRHIAKQRGFAAHEPHAYQGTLVDATYNNLPAAMVQTTKTLERTLVGTFEEYDDYIWAPNLTAEDDALPGEAISGARHIAWKREGGVLVLPTIIGTASAGAVTHAGFMFYPDQGEADGYRIESINNATLYGGGESDQWQQNTAFETSQGIFLVNTSHALFLLDSWPGAIQRITSDVSYLVPDNRAPAFFAYNDRAHRVDADGLIHRWTGSEWLYVTQIDRVGRFFDATDGGTLYEVENYTVPPTVEGTFDYVKDPEEGNDIRVVVHKNLLA